MCLTGIFIMLIRIKCLIPVRGGYVPIIMVVPVKEGIVAVSYTHLAYCETCAAIGNVYVNYRLFLLHGEAKYYDVLELSLIHI